MTGVPSLASRLVPRAVLLAPWLALGAFAASLGLQRIRSFDYWWHLRTGAWILEHGAVPRVDPYTYTALGSRWIDIHWLHQLGLHGLYRLGGHDAVVLAKVALVWALVVLLAPIGWRRARPAVSVAALAWMLAVASDRFMPRPELPSFVLLAALLAILDRYARRRDRSVYAIPLLHLVWVNVHGLFAVGLAVLAIHLAAELLRPLLVPGAALERVAVRRLASVAALSLLACLANPNGLDGLLYPLAQLESIGGPEGRGLFGSVIAELLPPLAISRTPSLALAAGLALAAAAAQVANWRRVPVSDPLMLVAFGYLGLAANRNLALLAIVAAPMLVRNLNAVLDRRPPRPGVIAAASLGVAALLGLATLDVARDRFFARLGATRETGLGTLDVFYPVAAAEWIARQRPLGPLFHPMASGGYLIWRLHPDHPVMVDGRLEVFGPERFVDLMAPGPERFQELDARYHFGVALIQYNLVESSDLLWWLYLNPNWRLVFVDDVAAVFAHRERSGRAAAPELDPDAEGLFPPLPGSHGPAARMRGLARTSFYMALHRPRRALQVWEEVLARHPDLPQGELVRATLLQRSGEAAAAEVLLRRLLDEHPDDPRLLAQVGDLRREAGDPTAARALYDRALAADTDYLYAAFRLGLLAEEEGDQAGAAGLYARVLARAEPVDPLALLAAERLEVLGGPLRH